MSEPSEQTQEPGSWKDQIPSDFRGAVDPFETIEDLAKGYHSLSTKLGADQNELIRIPKSGDYSEVYAKLGRPEKPDEYEFPEFKVDTPEDYRKFLAEKAHENGLTRSQLKNMLSAVDEYTAGVLGEQQKQSEQMAQTNEYALKQEFGDSYEVKMEKATGIANELFGEELGQKFLQSEVGKDPAFVKQLVKVAESLEEQPPAEGGERANFMDDAGSAQRKLDDIMNDPDKRDAYFNGNHPQHAYLVQEVFRLRSLAGDNKVVATL